MSATLSSVPTRMQPMDNAAFARAARFLNYASVAKWLSIVCGVAGAILFVALLLVVARFADLMVNRGDIPALHALPAREHAEFLERLALPENAPDRKTRIDEIRDGLKVLGLDE